MLTIGIRVQEVEPYLLGHEEHVKVAAINSAQSVTLSGDADGISRIFDQLQKEGIFCRRLATGGNAYHSHHMWFLGAGYEALLSQGLHDVKTPIAAAPRLDYSQWFSSVTPHEILVTGSLAPSYRRKNLESPVRFSEAVQRMLTSEVVEVDLPIEIRPHPDLHSPAKQT